MVDTGDLKSPGSNTVPVRVRSPAPKKQAPFGRLLFCIPGRARTGGSWVSFQGSKPCAASLAKAKPYPKRSGGVSPVPGTKSECAHAAAPPFQPRPATAGLAAEAQSFFAFRVGRELPPSCTLSK